VSIALAMVTCLEDQLHALRHQLPDMARHLKGARVLAERIYGAGPLAALALTCWPVGAGRFSPARNAVRFAGLDITVHSSDGKGPPGRLSRQGPPVLRRAAYEAGKAHARAAAPDHACYAQVKDRKGGKRAALSEARKIIRRACRILTGLGEAPSPPPDRLVTAAAARRTQARITATLTDGEQPRPAPAEPLSARSRPGRAARTA
jgi:transposase